MSEKIEVQVAARGTNNQKLRRRCGFAFESDLKEVEVSLEQFVAISEDKHLLVVGGPSLADAKAELERRKKAEQAARGAEAKVPSTVNFASRDDVAKALQAHSDRNKFLEEQNAGLQEAAQDLREELSETSTKLEQVLERLAKLEAGAGAKPAEAAKVEEKPAAKADEKPTEQSRGNRR